MTSTVTLSLSKQRGPICCNHFVVVVVIVNKTMQHQISTVKTVRIEIVDRNKEMCDCVDGLFDKSRQLADNKCAILYIPINMT